jgi:phosphatidate phosphatase PAH1
VADKLRGRFTYGVLDKDLSDEAVELWVQTCPGWVKWGQLQTDGDGIVFFDVPANLAQGDYALKMVVLGDQTVADGELAVWPKGVHAVVTDVDGTLTTSDWQLVQDVIFGKDAEMYPDANTVINAWAQKDYRIVYLTGRPQVVNRYTRTWLTNHGFPAGTLHLTEDVAQLPPTEAGVQKFKTDFLAGIQTLVGTLFKPAYGNAPTDAGAYLAVGIDKADVYIIGPNAGVSATQPVPSYTSHLPKIATYPDAVQP